MYKAKFKDRDVRVKFMKLEEDQTGIPYSKVFEKEADLLKKISHRYVLQIYGYESYV